MGYTTLVPVQPTNLHACNVTYALRLYACLCVMCVQFSYECLLCICVYMCVRACRVRCANDAAVVADACTRNEMCYGIVALLSLRFRTAAKRRLSSVARV